MGGDAVQTSVRHDDEDGDDGVPSRLSPEEWQAVIEHRLRRGSERMAALERGLSANTELTAEIRDLLELGRNGLRVLGYLGAVARWVAAVVAAGATLYGLFPGAHDKLPK
jgi:hypothetical protein